MPRIRKEYLEKQGTLQQSGTKQYQLNFSAPITAIDILIENTNGATSNTAERLEDEVSNIQLIDSGRVLSSLPLKEWMAVSHYHNKRSPYNVWHEGAAGVQYSHFRILFGRFYGDTNFFLDSKDYQNLQLKITNSFTESATIGWANDAGKITTIVHSMEAGVGQHKGVYLTESFFDVTSAASGDQTVHLPVDKDIALMTLIARKTLVEPQAVVNNVKILADNGAFTPFDERVLDAMIENQSVLPGFECHNTCLQSDDDSFLTPHFWQTSVQPFGTVDEEIPTVEAVTAESIQIGVVEYSTPGTPTLQTTNGLHKFRTKGYCPHGAVYFPFGDYWMGHTFDTRPYRALEARLTQAAASGQIRFLLTQVSPN